MHTRKQHLAVERLRHVVVSPGLEPAHDVVRLRTRGQHDDARRGKLRHLADAPRDGESIQPGEHYVQEHKVRLAAPRGLEPVVAAAGHLDVLEARAVQRHPEHRPDRRVVLDHEYLRLFVHTLYPDLFNHEIHEAHESCERPPFLYLVYFVV